MKRTGITVLALCGLLIVGGCNKKSEPVAEVPKTDWPALVAEWVESDFKANPDAAAVQGRHEFDGLLPDWSEAGLKAEIQRLKDWKQRTTAVDAATLNANEKFERDYLISQIDKRLFWIETADWPHRNPQYYFMDPGLYLDRPYADLATRMKAYTVWASSVTKATAQIKANLSGALPRAYIDIGLHTFGPLGEFLTTDVAKVFAGVGDSELQGEFAKKNAEAAASLADLQKYFESLRARQVDDFAMGPDLFAKMLLATEGVDTPLVELEAIGQADLKRNLDALTATCKEYAPGKTLKQCVAKSEAVKPEGGNVVAHATKQLSELKKFVQDHDIVTIPEGGEEAKVKQSPPYNSQNSAYIDVPGPYEKNMPSFYNVAAPDPSWSAAKQKAYLRGNSDVLFTSVHEVWPGHFLQFLHSNRVPSILGKLYVGYAFAEGWAHYAEELMWEMGLGNGDPEVHIGQITNAAWRDVRYLSAIGLHTKGMTLAESKRMFMDDAFQNEGNAEQQAARGAYDPAYLNYTLGKLMIRRLRADWCGKRTGAEDKACWRQFHDAFLQYGGPPIPMVRGAMMEEPAKSVF